MKPECVSGCLANGRRYLRPTRRRTAEDTPAKLAKRMSRRWRVVLLRAKGDSWNVEAADVAAAKAAAVVQFELDDVQRDRIIVAEVRGAPHQMAEAFDAVH